MDYRHFFIAWETVERVTECQALEAPQMSRDTRTTWLRDYGVRAIFYIVLLLLKWRSIQGLVSSAREQILKLLTMDWLVPETDIPGGMYSLMCCILYFVAHKNVLQPTDGRVNWRAYDSCSSRSSYSACTGSSSPRGHIYRSTFWSFSPHSRVLIATSLSLSFSVRLATSGMHCFWRMLLRTRDTCCSPSLRVRTDGS